MRENDAQDLADQQQLHHGAHRRPQYLPLQVQAQREGNPGAQQHQARRDHQIHRLQPDHVHSGSMLP
ncbi:hypothetical protein D3C72_2051550 [compost metagenome]